MSHRLCALVLLPLFLIPLAAADRYAGLDTAKFLGPLRVETVSYTHLRAHET